MRACLESEWGRLFANWEKLTPTAEGFPDVGPKDSYFQRDLMGTLRTGLGILGTTISEAPEVAARRRRSGAR